MGRGYLSRVVGGAALGGLLAALPLQLALDGSLKSWLYVLGGAEECVGVAFVASPELFPRISQAYGWSVQRSRTPRAWIQRAINRLRRRREVHSHDLLTAVETGAAMPIEAGRGFPAETAPLPQRVAFLQKVVQELDFRVASLDDRLKGAKAELSFEIKKTREELEALVRNQIRESAETHLEWRYAGLTLLFVGLALATAGNLVDL